MKLIPTYTVTILFGLISVYVPYTIIQQVEGAMIGLTLDQLARESELVISGTVLGEKLAFHRLINYSLSIEKVIKGNYTGNSISVLSQPTFVEDTVNLTKDEKVILFLYKEKIYGDQYAVTGMIQGKYEIDRNGFVHGYKISNTTTLTDFERNITNTLSMPKVNVTKSDL